SSEPTSRWGLTKTIDGSYVRNASPLSSREQVPHWEHKAAPDPGGCLGGLPRPGAPTNRRRGGGRSVSESTFGPADVTAHELIGGQTASVVDPTRGDVMMTAILADITALTGRVRLHEQEYDTPRSAPLTPYVAYHVARARAELYAQL